MATSFRDIYCLNQLIKNDPRLKKLSEEQYSMLSYGYLKFAISYFMYDCRTSLEYTAPTCNRYVFEGNGQDNEFLLSPSPDEEAMFIITTDTNGVESDITDYQIVVREHEDAPDSPVEPENPEEPEKPTDPEEEQGEGKIETQADEDSGEIGETEEPGAQEEPDEPTEPTEPIYDTVLILREPLAEGTVLKVVSFTWGEFVEDLDSRERVILAEAMNIPYIEEAKNDQNALKYIISGKSLRFFSQANHMGATIQNYNNQAYSIVNALISEYTYKGSIDIYRGLARRGKGGPA